MVMNFLSTVLIFEINVSNPSKKERKNKIKTLNCDKVNISFYEIKKKNNNKVK